VNEKVPLDSEQGKQQIDALLAKMTPEQQVEFKAALADNKPVHVHMDKDGTIKLGESADEAAAQVKSSMEEVPEAAPDAPVELKKDEPKKMSKMEQKRQQILMDRLKRKMGEPNKDGSPKTQQQAIQEMQREDYEAMPPDKKIARLEGIVSQSFQNLAQDLMGLHQSHLAISDAFDINYRATQKMFIKLGISNEDQKVIIAEAEKEVIASKQAAIDAENLERMNQMRARQAASEQKVVREELQKPASVVTNDAPVEVEELPKEATVFGG